MKEYLNLPHESLHVQDADISQELTREDNPMSNKIYREVLYNYHDFQLVLEILLYRLIYIQWSIEVSLILKLHRWKCNLHRSRILKICLQCLFTEPTVIYAYLF